MEMIIIASEQQKRLIMLFGKTMAKMSDKAVINDLNNHDVKSTEYPRFKTATDLRVERIQIPANPKTAELDCGDFLYRYLSKGYVCLGEHKGQPKPNLEAWGVRSVRKLRNIGFGL
ncbi:conserved protein of unknown function [Vibrio tapetis subsp. tapetis]|uniref:Uncharacterized protein n=2 Tax=Vibrio tapetis TaxID=52443 RepID=A0A2N8ZDA5_9VIBR|nr:conserved protein of unknown function [Vibrio tapetis subsp. tapetis]